MSQKLSFSAPVTTREYKGWIITPRFPIEKVKVEPILQKESGLTRLIKEAKLLKMYKENPVQEFKKDIFIEPPESPPKSHPIYNDKKLQAALKHGLSFAENIRLSQKLGRN